MPHQMKDRIDTGESQAHSHSQGEHYCKENRDKNCQLRHFKPLCLLQMPLLLPALVQIEYHWSKHLINYEFRPIR